MQILGKEVDTFFKILGTLNMLFVLSTIPQWLGTLGGFMIGYLLSLLIKMFLRQINH